MEIKTKSRYWNKTKKRLNKKYPCNLCLIEEVQNHDGKKAFVFSSILYYLTVLDKYLTKQINVNEIGFISVGREGKILHYCMKEMLKQILHPDALNHLKAFFPFYPVLNLEGDYKFYYVIDRKNFNIFLEKMVNTFCIYCRDAKHSLNKEIEKMTKRIKKIRKKAVLFAFEPSYNSGWTFNWIKTHIQHNVELIPGSECDKIFDTKNLIDRTLILLNTEDSKVFLPIYRSPAHLFHDGYACLLKDFLTTERRNIEHEEMHLPNCKKLNIYMNTWKKALIAEKKNIYCERKDKEYFQYILTRMEFYSPQLKTLKQIVRASH